MGPDVRVDADASKSPGIGGGIRARSGQRVGNRVLALDRITWFPVPHRSSSRARVAGGAASRRSTPAEARAPAGWRSTPCAPRSRGRDDDGRSERVYGEVIVDPAELLSRQDSTVVVVAGAVPLLIATMGV